MNPPWIPTRSYRDMVVGGKRTQDTEYVCRKVGHSRIPHREKLASKNKCCAKMEGLITTLRSTHTALPFAIERNRATFWQRGFCLFNLLDETRQRLFCRVSRFFYSK